MTDDEIREVFVELRRIGVDLGQSPGLAIGTGFSEGKLLPWLRALPDNLGHDEFAEQLDAHLAAAAPNVFAGEPLHEHRVYPTTEQLNAGIGVLIAEWDPLGARLGALSRDDVSIPAYNALGAILCADDDRLAERRVASMLADVEAAVFGVRPSPKEQRRYLARRLIQVVIANPGPPNSLPFEPERSTQRGRVSARVRGRRFVGPDGREPRALNPNATCTECSAIGTIAVVMREVEPTVSRYCPTCWVKVRDKYWTTRFDQPHVDDDDPASMIEFADFVEEKFREKVRFTSTALWEDHFDLIQGMASANRNASDTTRERYFVEMALALVKRAPNMYGPMPPEVQAFVRQHAGLDA